MLVEKILGFGILGYLVIIVIRHRSTARSITKAADRNVWAQASDARFPHYPNRRHTFARRRGLR